jgi:hypothetical protein
MLVGVALRGRPPRVVDLETVVDVARRWREHETARVVDVARRWREHEAETRALVEAGLLRPEWGKPVPPEPSRAA